MSKDAQARFLGPAEFNISIYVTLCVYYFLAKCQVFVRSHVCNSLIKQQNSSWGDFQPRRRDACLKGCRGAFRWRARAELAVGFVQLLEEFVCRLHVAKSSLLNCFACPEFFRSTSFVTREKA